MLEPLQNLKNEMDARTLDERYKKIIGSIVYFKHPQDLNDEIASSDLENIDIGPGSGPGPRGPIILKNKEDNKSKNKTKETLLDMLYLIINDQTADQTDEQTFKKLKQDKKQNKKQDKLKINLDYLLEIETETDLDLEYEKKIYFSKYKECSPIKRNANSNSKKYFQDEEFEETRL